MKRATALALVSLAIMLGSADVSIAQVKQIEMHIAGYLCGN